MVTPATAGALLLLPLCGTGTHVVVTDSTHGVCAVPRALSSATAVASRAMRNWSDIRNVGREVSPPP